MPFRHFILKTVVLILLFPVLASAQLREFDIAPVQSTRLPVFTQHPDKAAVIINSSLTNLQFDSNLEIVAILGNASEGEYILIVDPVRQIISVRAPGFQQGRITIAPNAPRQVLYYSVESKDREITDRGNLVVRTDPAGATVSIDGIPGEFTTPYMFENLIAVTHKVRIRLDGYRTEERSVRTENGRTVFEELRMVPVVGFITITDRQAQFFVALEGEEELDRVVLEPGKPIRLNPGTYAYRLERPFHRPAEGRLQVEAGGRYDVNPTLRPNFSTLRVRANAPRVQLSSTDNRAPDSDIPGTIYLEPGLRDVLIEAPGFASTRINIRSVAGSIQDTTVTLMSRLQAEEIERRQALPKGVLQLAADVDAEIYVNGQREGNTQIDLTLVPGTYDVEFRHPLKRERFSVDVPSAELVVRQVQLKPSKSVAMATSLLVPGGGHFYTKQWRGAVYLAAMAGAGVFIWQQNELNGQHARNHQSAFLNYVSAKTVADAALYKASAEAYRADANKAADWMTYGMIAAGAVYVLQLADIQFTRPRYGYRSASATMELGLAPTGIQLTYRLP